MDPDSSDFSPDAVYKSNVVLLASVGGQDLLFTFLLAWLIYAYVLAVRCLIKNGLGSWRTRFYLVAITTMLGCTLVYYILQLLWTRNLVHLLLGAEGASSYMPPSNAMFAANIVLGDIILLERTITVWGWHRPVVYGSVILLIATTGAWIVDAFTGDDQWPTVFSFLTVAWTTGLIAFKHWRHRRILHRHNAAPRYVALQGVYIVFVDSGLLYMLVWLTYGILCWLDAYSVTNMSRTALDFIYIVLLVLVAFYPMVVVILVTRYKIAPHDEKLSSIQSCTVGDVDSSTLEPLVGEAEPKANTDVVDVA
ncbi:unnamed protein product [Peniophora sp. CBMAI 1063]|nr:unnamed protein product [Peniophora sp. CBMAI 1063]